LHEKVDRVLAIKFKRRTSSFGCICPWVIVIQHIDKHDSEGPHIGSTRRIRGRNVVSALVAHIGRGPAIHVCRLDIVGRQAKVGELDDDLALLPAIWRFDPPIGDDKVLGFDVPVKNVHRVTDGDSLTHLREHGGDEA
jgi:hypothetical protein